MNNLLISVIVPIYNVEIYLPRCLESIGKQTYKDIEIILIDDGSPDNSGKICDEYAAKDSRIRVFHISNGGVAKARQLGVENSTGEYIVFVDPDDWLTINSIETLFSNMRDDIDLVIGSYQNVSDSKTENRISKEEYLSDLLSHILCHNIYPTPWGKIFRRRVFSVDSFPNFKKSEDWLMFIEISPRLHRAKVITDIVYYYYTRETSAVHSFNDSLDYYINYLNEAKKILLSNGMYESHRVGYHEFALICLNRVNSGRRPVDKKNIVVQALLSEISYKSLSPKGRVRYLTIKYRLYNMYVALRRRCIR